MLCIRLSKTKSFLEIFRTVSVRLMDERPVDMTQTHVYQMRTLPPPHNYTLNYLTEIIEYSENVDSKFKRVVFEWFNIVY